MGEITQYAQQLQQLTLICQQLQQDNQELRERLLSNESASSSVRKWSEPKICLPEKFDGTRSKLRGFLNQIQLVIQLHSHRYPTDREQVGLVGSLLSGPALTWFAPLLEKQAPELLDFTAFTAALTACFGDTDRQRTAVTKLSNLRQGSRPASAYASEFRQIALDTTWDDVALRDCFRRGLREDVKDMLLSMEDPQNLEEAIRFAVRCDNRLFERRQEKRSPFVPPVSAPSVSSTVPAPLNRPVGPEPMQIGRVSQGPLSAAERQRRREANLCFYCGGAGHPVRDCPVRSPSQSENFSGRSE